MARAELSRASEEQRCAERERDELQRERERMEGVIRTLEEERERLQLDREELR